MNQKVYVVLKVVKNECVSCGLDIEGVFSSRESAEKEVKRLRDEVLKEWNGNGEVEQDVSGYFSIYEPNDVDAVDIWISEQPLQA